MKGVRSRPLRLRAFAKLNLDLRVLGRRDDGYHEVRTLMQTIDLHDDLTVRATRRPGLHLACTGLRHVPVGSENLAYRAADCVLREYAPDAGIAIHLCKRIPMGAGLGGGSSDCAVTLRAVNRLLGLGLGMRDLERLGARFGSDVPYFLQGGLCAAYGRGEKICSVGVSRRLRVLLLLPRLHVSTADAYRWYAAREPTAPGATTRRSIQNYASRMGEAISGGDWTRMRNDLQAAVFERHPRLRVLQERLHRSGALHVQMTGSGSAVFAKFRSPARLRAAVSLLQDEAIDARICSFVSGARSVECRRS